MQDHPLPSGSALQRGGVRVPVFLLLCSILIYIVVEGPRELLDSLHMLDTVP